MKSTWLDYAYWGVMVAIAIFSVVECVRIIGEVGRILH